jgi:death-on-curing protein
VGEAYFLSLDQILRLHASLIQHYGGAPAVRDMGLLQSAVAMPHASFGGEVLHPTLFDQAAAYLFHLVQNHPFMDGNKRIGAASAIVFLAMNDVQISGDEDGLVELTMAVASGRAGKSEISNWFSQHVRG